MEGVAASQFFDEGDGCEKYQQHNIPFPVEILEMIFQYVLESKDLYNIQSSCRLFRSIVSPRRSTFLFYKVFPILRPFMREAEVLKCRMVARRWKCAVNDTLAIEFNPPLVYGESKSSFSRFPLPSASILHNLQKNYCFQNVHSEYLQPGVFLASMEENPDEEDVIIGRAMSLRITASVLIQSRRAHDFQLFWHHGPTMLMQDRTFWSDVGEVFQRYGSGLHSLTIKIDRGHNAAYYKKLEYFIFQKLANAMRNLKRLSINGNLPVCDRDQGFIEPELSLLESFEITGVRRRWEKRYDATGDFIAALNGPNVKRVKLNWNLWFRWGMRSLKWSNLREFHLVEIERSIPPEHLMYAKLPNLTKLGLGFSTECRFPEVAAFVNSLSESTKLVNLVLTAKFSADFGTSVITGMSFNAITTLEFELIGAITPQSFAFVSHFPCVQVLQIIVPMLEKNETDDTEGDVFGLYMLLTGRLRGHVHDNMAIWKHLPHLKVFSVNDKIYTRSGYERNML